MQSAKAYGLSCLIRLACIIANEVGICGAWPTRMAWFNAGLKERWNCRRFLGCACVGAEQNSWKLRSIRSLQSMRVFRQVTEWWYRGLVGRAAGASWRPSLDLTLGNGRDVCVFLGIPPSYCLIYWFQMTFDQIRHRLKKYADSIAQSVQMVKTNE